MKSGLIRKCSSIISFTDRREATTKANLALLAELAQITNASPLHDAAPDYIAATLGEWHGIRRASAWDSFPVLAIFLVAPLGEWLLLRRHGYA